MPLPTLQHDLSSETIQTYDHFRQRERNRFRENRKGRIPVMDAETLRELCLENAGYETPELNDSLYAHFHGFQRIEGLEAYCNLKALWLESNGLCKIENLHSLTQLRCLYLGKNLIERIENLECLSELRTLSLCDNRLTTLSGLDTLTSLETLDVSRNFLENCDSLVACCALKSLDVSHNRIEGAEILQVVASIPNLRSLRITGNPIVSQTKFFRKTVIAAIPKLAYLDRPIFPVERAAVAAWQTGGTEAELEAWKAFVSNEHKERQRTLQEFRDWQENIRQQRLSQDVGKQPKLREERACASPTNQVETDDVDLKGFRGITKEQFACLPASEKEIWASRIDQAHEDAVQAAQSIKNDGVLRAGRNFWAKGSSNSESADFHHTNNVDGSPKKHHGDEEQHEPALVKGSSSKNEDDVATLSNLHNNALPPPPPLFFLTSAKSKERNAATTPADEVVPRDSWDHLVTSSQAEPFTPRFMSIPRTLPSMLSPQEDDSESTASATSDLHVLSRDEILLEIHSESYNDVESPKGVGDILSREKDLNQSFCAILNLELEKCHYSVEPYKDFRMFIQRWK
nr:conserved hypothetical protein [Albugo laibachii Nc14]|eukprot:CCA20456.1 conserved hypothetical protein [Albugo laibachii Nc14]